MPAEVGGGGLSAVELCLTEEQIDRVTGPLRGNIFGSVYPMLMHCTPSQKERYLHPVMRGEKVGVIAITEPEVGSDSPLAATRLSS